MNTLKNKLKQLKPAIKDIPFIKRILPHSSIYFGGFIFFMVYLLHTHGYDYTGKGYDVPYIATAEKLESKDKS